MVLRASSAAAATIEDLQGETMPSTDSRHLNVFSLYDLPPFVVTFSADEPSGASTLWSVEMNFKRVTEKYLEDFFKASLLNTATTLRNLRSIDLDVSLRQQGTRRSRLRSLQSSSTTTIDFWAEAYGEVAFFEPVDPSDRVSTEQARDLLRQLVQQAFNFEAIPIYQQRLRTSTDPVLQSVKMLLIDTNYNPEVSRGSNNNRQAAQNGGNFSSWSTAEFVLLGLLVTFLLVSAATLIMFVRADRRKLRYGDGAHPEYVDMVPRNFSSPMMQASSNPQHNGSGGNPDVVPVPDDNGERRYVTPSSPFDMLYGASFLHQDYRNLLQGKRKAKKRNYAPTTAGIKPMLQIEEAGEEEENLGGSSHSDKGIGSWFRSLTSKMDCKKQEDDEVVNQDHPFVYRDFPRHDGTPCLMYDGSNHGSNHNNPRKDVSYSAAKMPALPSQLPPQLAIEVPETFDVSMHSTGSHTSIDNFVDTLETLMRMKHKQYQERTKMEQERLERKRRRETARSSGRASPAHQQRPLSPLSPPRENPLTPVMERPSKTMTTPSSDEQSTVDSSPLHQAPVPALERPSEASLLTLTSHEPSPVDGSSLMQGEEHLAYEEPMQSSATPLPLEKNLANSEPAPSSEALSSLDPPMTPLGMPVSPTNVTETPGSPSMLEKVSTTTTDVALSSEQHGENSATVDTGVFT